MLRTTDSLLILVLYVDDLLITDNSVSMIASVKGILHDRFSMTDMGPLHFFLGLEINRMHQASSYLRLSMLRISWRDST
jgi:hypothetical protein